MRKSTSRIFTLTARNLKEVARDPLSLVFMMALPLFMEVVFYFLFSKMTSQFEMKYLAPGIVVFSQAFLSLFTGLLIAVDRGSAFLTRLYVSRARPYEFIFGYALSLLPASLVQTVLFFLIGGLIDRSIFCVGMLYCIPLSLVTALLFVGAGILFGSLCTEKSIGGVCSIVIAGQSVLSGMWFPVEGLGGGMLAVMRFLPFKNATELMQNTLNGIGDPFADFWRPLFNVLAYAAALFAVAIVVFRKKMKSI